MKKINCKNQMIAYRSMVGAEKHLQFCRGLGTKWSYAYDVDKAQAQYDDAKAAYTATLAPIEEAIKQAEGRATVRTITAAKLIMTLADVEDKLGISKKSLQGIKVCADLNAQKLPNAYKWRAESTHFTAEYKSGNWVITDIRRDYLSQRNTEIEIVHTDASKAALIERFTRF